MTAKARGRSCCARMHQTARSRRRIGCRGRRDARRMPNGEGAGFSCEFLLIFFVVIFCATTCIEFPLLVDFPIIISQIELSKSDISAAELQASRAQQNLTAKSLEFERLQVCCFCVTNLLVPFRIIHLVLLSSRFVFTTARAERGPLACGQAGPTRVRTQTKARDERAANSSISVQQSVGLALAHAGAGMLLANNLSFVSSNHRSHSTRSACVYMFSRPDHGREEP